MDDQKVSEYFVVSVPKLGRLFVFTFGFYGIYRFYKQWKLQQQNETPQISPVWRSIFSIFFVYGLFQRISKSLVSRKPDHQFSAVSMATAFIVITILSNVISMLFEQATPPAYSGVIMLISVMLMAYPLQEAQEAINDLEGDPLGEVNANYDWVHWISMVVGGLLWLSVLVSPVLSAMLNVEVS